MDEEMEYRKWRNGKSTYRQQIVAPVFIGKGCCSPLIEFEMDFPVRYPCVELKQVNTYVRDLSFNVCKDRVIVNGMLFCSIDYKVYEGKAELRCGYLKQDGVFGSIKNITACLPFGDFAETNGSLPGDEVKVDFSGTENSSGLCRLEKPSNIPGTGIVGYGKLKQTVLAKIVLKVLRQTSIPVKIQQNCPPG